LTQLVAIGVQLSGSDPLDDPPLDEDDPPLDDDEPPLDEEDPPLEEDEPPLEEPPLDEVDPPDDDELPVLPDEPPDDDDVPSCGPVPAAASSSGDVGAVSLPVPTGDVVVVAHATLAEQAKANAKRRAVRMSPV
jgi:hypothetical protein